jgi:hypothetical protein
MKTYKADGALTPLIINLTGGRKWVADLKLWLLDIEKWTAVPSEYETWWTPDPVWTFRRMENFLPVLELELSLPVLVSTSPPIQYAHRATSRG